jgi:hypothetical protein
MHAVYALCGTLAYSEQVGEDSVLNERERLRIGPIRSHSATVRKAIAWSLRAFTRAFTAPRPRRKSFRRCSG